MSTGAAAVTRTATGPGGSGAFAPLARFCTPPILPAFPLWATRPAPRVARVDVEEDEMAELEKFSMLIGGKAVDALSGKTFESRTPTPASRGR